MQIMQKLAAVKPHIIVSFAAKELNIYIYLLKCLSSSSFFLK
jgi:hypothetical protein